MRAVRPRRADPGPDDRDACRRSRRSSASSSSCRSSSGRRAASTATRPRSSTPTDRCSACIARCTSRDDPLFNEKYYFTPGDAATTIASTRSADREAGERLPRLEDAVREHRRADLLGSVVSRGRAHHVSLLGAEILFYPTAIGWHPGGEGRVRAGAGRRVAHDSALARDRERRLRRVAESRRPRGRAGHATASSSSATRSSPIRSAASSPKRGTEQAVLIATCDPKLIEETRRNWPFLRDRRIDAYAPILSRYLGDVDPTDHAFVPAEWSRARGDVDRVAASRARLARQARADSVGVRRDRARAARARARRDSLPRRGRSRRRRASISARTASTANYRLHVVPNDRVWLRDSAPTGVVDDDGAVIARQLALQRLGEVRQLRARRAGRRGRRRDHRSAARRAGAARQRRARRARGRRDRDRTAKARCS